MKRLLLLVLALAMSLCLAACGSQAGSSQEKVYIEDSEIDDALSNPDSYSGKYIKISGKVFNVDKDGDAVALQIWHDVSNYNYSQDYVVLADKSIAGSVAVDDFVMVDGVITGTFTGSNAFGTTLQCMQIEAESIEVGSYDELIAPADKVVEVDDTSDQHGFSVTVEKIEFAGDETRVYLSAVNDSDDTVSLYLYGAKAIQNGKQFEHQDNYEAGDQDVGEVLAGASKDGVVRFTGLDPEESFTLNLEAYSEDYNITMEDFSFDLNE